MGVLNVQRCKGLLLFNNSFVNAPELLLYLSQIHFHIHLRIYKEMLINI